MTIKAFTHTKKNKKNKCCSFELSMHQREKNMFPIKILSSKTVFNIISYDDNKICNKTKCSLNIKSAY